MTKARCPVCRLPFTFCYRGNATRNFLTINVCPHGHRWTIDENDQAELLTDHIPLTSTKPQHSVAEGITAALAVECDNERSEGGEIGPCGRPAVGWRYDEGHVYPVCVGHVRHPMVAMLTATYTGTTIRKTRKA